MAARMVRLVGNAPCEVTIKRRKRALLRLDKAHIRARLKTCYVGTQAGILASVRAYIYLSSTQRSFKGLRWPFLARH